MTAAAADLILQLLTDPKERLGNHGTEEIKQHRFFDKIMFNGLRQQTAPYAPTIRHAMDTSNFDPVDPEKLRFSNDNGDDSKRRDFGQENGKHPEHGFFEFTFRRFFDDGGHPYPDSSTVFV